MFTADALGFSLHFSRELVAIAGYACFAHENAARLIKGRQPFHVALIVARARNAYRRPAIHFSRPRAVGISVYITLLYLRALRARIC